MTEKIGKVTLDYGRYPGEDFYCDGSVEDELLEIVKTYRPEEYAGVIEERNAWPVLYHLSSLRENIVDWLPMDGTEKVLEVGSGCGAITGALSRKGASVTCVDLSKKRSLINAYRHQDCENVTIHVGNFRDIEPDLPGDYDYICLIGVFEYGQAYIGGESPYEDFLKILMRHLAPGGRLYIAIENKLGLKYFAGCREDHLGSFFSGIENYEGGGGVRTFSRPGLEEIFRACGAGEFHFYYPYPDYKFPTALYSDKRLPRRGELSNNLRNFDRDRMLLFNEKSAFDGLIQDGLFPVFSNSYAVVVGPGFPVRYVKYSNDRAPRFAIRTEITETAGGGLQVRKLPLTPAAADHVRGMEESCERLTERYKGGKLRINSCALEEGRDGVSAVFPFEKGIPLSDLLDGCLEREDHEGFLGLFREYTERTGYHGDFPAADFDLIFSNLLVEGEEWTLIDYEWTFERSFETKELAYRAVYCYLLEEERRKKLNVELIMRELGVSEEDARRYRDQEMEFQKYVTGQRCSMAEIRERIGHGISKPLKWAESCGGDGQACLVQIYEDTGEGFREEQSYFVPDALRGENRIELELKVESGVKRIRIDPAMASCVVKPVRLSFNGRDILPRDRRTVETNGRSVGPADRAGGGWPAFVFATPDPNISIRLEEMNREADNILRAELEIVRMPLGLAEDLAAGGVLTRLGMRSGRI